MTGGLMAFNTEADGTVTVRQCRPHRDGVDALLGFAERETQRQDLLQPVLQSTLSR